MLEINKIYNEDCIGEKGMCLISDKSVDMILCDLSYGTTACKWDTIIPFESLWEQCERVVKENGAIVLFGNEPFTSDLIRILTKHEDIIIFYKKLPIYNPQMEDGEPYKKRSSMHKNIEGNAVGTKGNIKYSENLDTSKRYPTQKPVSLLEYLIKTYSNENELILDNCAGSGSTAIACINTNRNYIGFEMDKTYFEVANERINKHNK